MKILHVIIGLNVGGAELMLKRLVALHIDNPDYHHSVVSLCDIGKIGQQLSELGIKVEAFGLRSIVQFPRVFFQLFRVIRSQRPDIVQTWMYHADLIGGLAARLAGCRKVIWGIRNTDLFSSNGISQTTCWIMKLCAVLSDFVPHTILCVANRAKTAHANAGYALNKMIVLSNGFDVEAYKPELGVRHFIRKSLNVPSDALIVGSIGRFNEYKDHRGFVLAAAKLAAVDNRIYFLLVGRDVDSNNATIIQWIEETGYANRFILLGERSDVPAVLAAMDIFCLHSKSEGFPNVLGEAMCAGLPSVVTDVGDAAVLLGEAGLVVSPKDAEALMQGLLAVVQYSPESRALLGNIACNRIKDNYSIDIIKRQYEDLYQKVVNE